MSFRLCGAHLKPSHESFSTAQSFLPMLITSYRHLNSPHRHLTRIHNSQFLTGSGLPTLPSELLDMLHNLLQRTPDARLGHASSDEVIYMRAPRASPHVHTPLPSSSSFCTPSHIHSDLLSTTACTLPVSNFLPPLCPLVPPLLITVASRGVR